jgi:hypothetical protein
MPSRMKVMTIQTDGVGAVIRQLIRAPGNAVTQITPVILPDTAIGKVALQIGDNGDPVPLMIQGQTFNLDGVDQTGGLWLMAPAGTFPGVASGELQFFLSDRG